MFAGMSFHCDFKTKINIEFTPEDILTHENTVNDIVGFPFLLEMKTNYGAFRFYLTKEQVERVSAQALSGLQEYDRIIIERKL